MSLTLGPRDTQLGPTPVPSPVGSLPGSPERKRVTNTKRRASIKKSNEFLTDEEIAASTVFQVLKKYFFWYPFMKWFHCITVVGHEQLESREGGLFIGMHTTHNADIMLNIYNLQEATGIVTRGLFHRTLMKFHPWLRMLGGVPGQRNSGINLIQHGYYPGCLPGGAEEAIRGHANSYDLHWISKSGNLREGFAHLACGVGRPTYIYPLFTQNAEEMRWNPLHWFCNLIRLTWLFDRIMHLLTFFPFLQNLWFQVGIMFWFCTSFSGIPIPVPVTLHVLPGIPVDPSDDPKLVARKVYETYKGHIQKLQPSAPNKDYLAALKQRFAPVPKQD